jgi:hypothetical protein
MAIALSAVVPVELRAPANPVASKGNVTYTRSFRLTIPVSTTAAALVLGGLPPGTAVVAAYMDTDTSFGSHTIALSTATSTFVAAKAVTATGGYQLTLAANTGVVVPSSATADGVLTITTATGASPASIVVADITLVLASIGPVESTYETYDT